MEVPPLKIFDEQLEKIFLTILIKIVVQRNLKCLQKAQFTKQETVPTQVTMIFKKFQSIVTFHF